MYFAFQKFSIYIKYKYLGSSLKIRFSAMLHGKMINYLHNIRMKYPKFKNWKETYETWDNLQHNKKLENKMIIYLFVSEINSMSLDSGIGWSSV